MTRNQLTLDGFDAPPQRTDRLFFALFPAPPTAAHIARLAAALRQQLGLKGTPLEASRLHITLNHLGDHPGLPPGLVEEARRAASLLPADGSAAPFDVSFERAESFNNRQRTNHPFVLRGDETGLAGVLAFQRLLGTAMARAGLGRWVEPRFTPHVTLLYDDQVIAAQPVEPVRWQVSELVLVHSLIGRHQHVVLGRWPLRG